MTRIDRATLRRLGVTGGHRSRNQGPAAASGLGETGRVGARLASMVTQTDGERALSTQAMQLGLPTPIHEYRFHRDRAWRFDLAWPDLLVAAEVEGATWATGRHSRGQGYEDDCIKYDEAAIAGWLVIRVTTDMVDDGRAVALVERAIATRIAAAYRYEETQ